MNLHNKSRSYRTHTSSRIPLERSRTAYTADARLRSTYVAKHMEGGSAALQALLDTIAKIDQIDLAELDIAVEAKRTQLDRKIAELEKGVLTGRKAKKRPGRPFNNGRNRQHWRTRKKYLKEYHRTVRAPKNLRARLDLLRKDGWWGVMQKSWKRRRIPIEVTKEEWEETVGTLEEYIPYVQRLDTRLGIRLDNVLVKDRDSGEVLFDGGLYSLRQSGQII